MNHLKPFQPRTVVCLPTARTSGWTLKRYAILAEDKEYNEEVALTALDAAIVRLPKAMKLENPDGNHGVGFQLIHYAEVAVVSPIFYWMWGSVLANTHQIRAQWDTPTTFEHGVREVVGCVWELDVIAFEIEAWKNSMLAGQDTADHRLSRYLQQYYAG